MSDDDVREYKNMLREKYLKMHKAPITQGTKTDKRWTTRVPDKSKADGRRIIRKPTKEAVENEVIKYYMELERSAKRNDVTRIITVSEFFLLWIEESTKKHCISSETVRRYQNDYKRFIQNNAFGNQKVRSVDGIDIEQFLIEVVQRFNLKKKALNNLYGYLKNMFEYARRQRIIKENPCNSVDMKYVRPYCDNTIKPDAKRVLSNSEVTILLEQVHKQQAAYPLYMPNYAIEICVYTGLRVGEVVALKWDHIQNGELLINESEHRIHHEGSASTYEIGATKNGKTRLVPICDNLQAVFDKIRAIHEKYDIHSEYIIADAKGRLTAPSVSNAMYRRGIETGIGAKSIHALRRTVSSRLNTCLPSATVALIMGHTEEVNRSYYNYDTLERQIKLDAMTRIYAPLS